MRYLLLFSLFLSTTILTAQKALSELYEKRQFHLLDQENQNRQNPDYYYYKALYAAACNQPQQANKYLDSLHSQGKFNKVDYWKLRNDNYYKLFDYRNTLSSLDSMLKHAGSSISKSNRNQLLDVRKLWAALQNEPPQTISAPFQRETITTQHDEANLTNIKVRSNGHSQDFVFDTGASFSCISETNAQKMGLRILEGHHTFIKSFNGIYNKAAIGVCPELEIGNIKIQNAFFLVFKDKDLRFRGSDYAINGIVGFPIACNLGTLSIYQDSMIVQMSLPTDSLPEKNLFIDYFEPIVLLRFEGDTLQQLMPYSFDTGASNTLLFRTFLEHFQYAFVGKTGHYALRGSSSVGGTRTYKVMVCPDVTLFLGKDRIFFKEADVDVYNQSSFSDDALGNVGRDLLQGAKGIEMSFKYNYLRLLR